MRLVSHLRNLLVGVKTAHAVLEGGEDTTLDVEGPQRVAFTGADLLHCAILLNNQRIVKVTA
jgi:hypothetical protein